MSVNGSTQTDFYTDRASRNPESSETTPLLGNGSVQPRTTGASFASSVFNLMNAIMGSGILGLAYAMAGTGIVGFCTLLVLVAFLAAFSLHLLLKLCDETGINSYEGLGEKALQKPGKVLRSMSSYLFILKSELPAAICSLLGVENTGTVWYENGKLLLVMITVFVVLPLSLLPKIGFLGYTSSISFIFILYFTVVVVVKKWSIPCPLPQNGTRLRGTFEVSNSSASDCTPKLFVVSVKSAYAIPTMAFSFLCHTAILPIYCELQRPSKSKMQNISNIGIGLSFLLYFISALFGYLTFYGHVKSELLLGYDYYLLGDIMVMSVRVAILLSVLLTVPLIHFPARKAMILLLFGGRSFSWRIHIISTLIILSVVLMLAIFVPDIRTVFGIVGSTTSTCLLFIFPGIFYLKISRSSLKSVDSVGALLLVIFGVMMGVISLSTIIITWIMTP
uniref:Solute carrier family 38, member 6 n=1 Tax=Nothobranchius furzeri TaxID=105023 RepID=A0A1A8USV9_NOTFU